MAYHPNVPAPTNRVQDDIAAMRDNFQHLAPLAQAVGELQTVSGLAPVAGELQAVSELAPYVQALLDSRIVEMGFNTNGRYVRWENGLQVCWHRNTDSDTTTPTQYGSIYKGEGRTWTYPAMFVVAPTVWGAFERSSDDRAGFIGWHSIGVDRAVFYVATTASWSNLSMNAPLVAVGRWK